MKNILIIILSSRQIQNLSQYRIKKKISPYKMLTKKNTQWKKTKITE